MTDQRTCTETRIITATADGDDQQLLALLTASSVHAYPYVGLVADHRARREALPRYFRHELARARAQSGTVRVLANYQAAAVWVPHDGAPEPDPEPYPPEIAGPWADRMDPFAHQRHQLRTGLVGDQPHVHVLALAVQPGCHGHGLDTRLIDDQLARNDAEGITTYADPGEEPLMSYLRDFGFEPATSRRSVRVGPAFLYPMIREPQHP